MIVLLKPPFIHRTHSGEIAQHIITKVNKKHQPQSQKPVWLHLVGSPKIPDLTNSCEIRSFSDEIPNFPLTFRISNSKVWPLSTTFPGATGRQPRASALLAHCLAHTVALGALGSVQRPLWPRTRVSTWRIIS